MLVNVAVMALKAVQVQPPALRFLDNKWLANCRCLLSKGSGQPVIAFLSPAGLALQGVKMQLIAFQLEVLTLVRNACDDALHDLETDMADMLSRTSQMVAELDKAKTMTRGAKEIGMSGVPSPEHAVFTIYSAPLYLVFVSNKASSAGRHNAHN